jgi:hypothetical protein
MKLVLCVGFQTSQPQNAIHVLPHRNISSTEAKWYRTQLFDAVFLCLDGNLGQARRKLGELPHRRTSAQFNVSFHFENNTFYYISI